LVGLEHARGMPLQSFSKGMLQRIGIAQAIVNDPQVVILDEPMSGLDPIGRKDVRDIILRLRDQKKTILFSSHILPDIEALCDAVAILMKGELKAFGALSDLVNPRVKNTEILFQGAAKAAPPDRWKSRVGVRAVGTQTVVSSSDAGLLEEILQWGRGSDLRLLSVSPQKESLEDLFVAHLEQAQ
jgi:ABC-2 type transport system ATP-binding protein